MSEVKPRSGDDALPAICLSAGCGRTLHARLKHCPYCGAPQRVEQVQAAPPPPPPVEPQAPVPGKAAKPAGTAETPPRQARQPVPPATPATPVTPPPAANTAKAEPERKSTAGKARRPGSAAPDAAPPVDAPVRKPAAWKRMAWIGLLCVLAYFGLRQHNAPDEADTARERACNEQGNLAFKAARAGQKSKALKAIEQARSSCSGETLDAIGILEQQIRSGQKLTALPDTSACSQIEGNARNLLADSQPGRALDALQQGTEQCDSRPDFQRLQADSRAATSEARKLLARARTSLNAAAFSDAESFALQARQKDALVAGVDQVLAGIAEGRAQMELRRAQRSPGY